MTTCPYSHPPSRPSDRPIVGVGVVVFKNRSVLLIRRGKPPRLGEWSIPGGAQKLGETTLSTAFREVREETGITIEAAELLDVIDSIHRDEETGAIQQHYTLVDYVARWQSGTPCGMSDAAHAAWVAIDDIDNLPMWSETRRIIHLGRMRLGLSLKIPGAP